MAQFTTTPMTVGELVVHLSKFPPASRVVIDVNADQCMSDRNVLDICEARLDGVGRGEEWVFIQALGEGATIKES